MSQVCVELSPAASKRYRDQCGAPEHCVVEVVRKDRQAAFVLVRDGLTLHAKFRVDVRRGVATRVL